MRIKRSLLLMLLLFFPWNKVLYAQEPVYVFLEPDGSKGKIHPLTDDDMRLHPMEGIWYTESYFFIAFTDQGYVAYLNLIVSNLGLKKNQPALTLTIITPDGQRYTTEQEFPPESLKESKGPFSISIFNNLLSGDSQNLYLRVSQDELGMELKFSSPVAGFKLGDGKIHFGKDKSIFFAINYPAPRARIEGQISIKGNKIKVDGWGYVDHSYYNANTVEFEKVWHNFKFFSDSYTIILTSFTTPEKYQEREVGLAGLIDDHKVLCASTELEVRESKIKTMPEGKKPYPQELGIQVKCGAYRIETVFDSSNVIETMDVLQKLNKGATTKALKWLINTFVTNPYYYRASSQADVKLSSPEGKKLIKGKGVSEVIFVK